MPLSFIYPPLFHLKLQKAASPLSKCSDLVVVVLGSLTFVYVTFSNIKKWSIE